MDKNSVISTIYKPINTLYSANYTCLRISDQGGVKQNTSNIYTSQDLFGKPKPTKFWVSQKLDDASRNRNGMINGLNEHFGPNDETIITFKQSFEDIKQNLLDIYNIWFDQNKTFDELFDNFKCKDKTFAKMINDYESSSIFMSPHIEVMHLMASYQTYIDTLIQFMTIEAFEEITKTLIDEVTNYGNPSIFFGKTHNPKLTSIGDKELDAYQKKVTPIKDKLLQSTKEKDKQIVLLYKKRKKQKKSDGENYSYEIEKLKSELFDLASVTSKCEDLLKYLAELNKRYIAANTNYNSSKLNDFCEDMLDVLTGTSFASSNKNFSVKSIYVTNLELDYIDYLFEILKSYAPENSASKTTESEKQQ